MHNGLKITKQETGLTDKQAPRIARWQMMLNQQREMFVQHLWMCVFSGSMNSAFSTFSNLRWLTFVNVAYSSFHRTRIFHSYAFLETGPKPVLFNFTVTSQEPIQSAVVSVPVAEASNLYCQPCGINFTSLPHATQHYQGKNHAKKLKSLTAASQTNNQSTIVGSQKSLGNSSFLYCLTAEI